MKELSLGDLIAQTRNAIKPMRHSQSTLLQYNYAWGKLCDFFAEHGTTSFSVELARHYVMKTRQQYELGTLKAWKFKLFRKTVELLIQYYENFCVKWNRVPKWGKTGLKEPVYIAILKDYIHHSKKEGYGKGTIDLYKTVCYQFLRYLEQEKIRDFSELTLKDVSRFIPYASRFYQPTQTDRFIVTPFLCAPTESFRILRPASTRSSSRECRNPPISARTSGASRYRLRKCAPRIPAIRSHQEPGP